MLEVVIHVQDFQTKSKNDKLSAKGQTMALLENIRTYTRVVELGGLSAAGRDLRLSPAVVSHRIQQLESHLGVRLLHRTTRQLQPTEHGLAFYRGLS